MNARQWEVNLTRGITYRHGLEWSDDNAKNMKELLKDFKVRKKNLIFYFLLLIKFSHPWIYFKTKDVRIIIANFNKTVAIHMFCHVS